MKVLMLGWEYPPHISGGLGTACEGLSRSLAQIGTELTFIVPHLYGDERAEHMRMFDADGHEDNSATTASSSNLRLQSRPIFSSYGALSEQDSVAALRRIAQHHIPAELLQVMQRSVEESLPLDRYSGDLFTEVARFASKVTLLFKDLDFDLVHAHDWMTFPAGVALAKARGVPLVVHVHSLEQDRSGAGANHRISEIERWGIDRADAAIAVSYYTRGLIQQLHGVPTEKLFVVHNGIYSRQVVQRYRDESAWASKVVLFLGRVTFQKGPDYFVEAAARVVPHIPDVLFILAGAGDMLPRMIDRVRELGIMRNFFFPGFVRGDDVERMFSIADLYVMPSVSEPFGIAALEAISYDTPVVISKQSGVAEVLGHALKVDFWDVDKLAELMINALLHDELREDMISMAREELKRVHWDAAAIKAEEIYRDLLNR